MISLLQYIFFKKRPTLGLYSKALINYNNLTVISALSKGGGVTGKGLTERFSLPVIFSSTHAAQTAQH